MERLERFQKRIQDVIPLTRAMEAELVGYDGRQLTVRAPLAPNSNHQGTGFGGAIYSLAVLAAWGLVELLVADAGIDGQVVIQSGSMAYGKPVDADFFAQCELPDAETRERFIDALRRKGRARLALTSRVYCGEPESAPTQEPVAAFEGRFVVKIAPLADGTAPA